MKIGLFLVIAVLVVAWSEKRYRRRREERRLRHEAGERMVARILGKS